ncbi:MAG: hypothetical protein EXR62_17360 [Chloroflexi bacterium]|nr:hypothetical protein [Chloroflexota bacterium]
MSNYISRIRSLVVRQGAERYLLLTLLSFGTSVSLTRLFLRLTGYPQIGGGGLHIAHVLWGGLLLFIAALLPVIFANRWVYAVGGLLSGVGVGLFIDEVGKFITQNNDYFYPLAAPIIYAVFLLTVLLYVQIRRRKRRDPRTELFGVLDDLQEVLDHDLDEQEYKRLQARLAYIARETQHPDVVKLAIQLQEFLASGAIELVPTPATAFEQWIMRSRGIGSQWLSRVRLRFVLVLGLALSGLPAIFDLLLVALIIMAPQDLRQAIYAALPPDPSTYSSLTWFVVRLVVEGVVGVMLLSAAGFWATGREQRGTAIGFLGLLLALTTVDLLGFYFDQFVTVVSATFQFILLLGVRYYQQRYL